MVNLFSPGDMESTFLVLSVTCRPDTIGEFSLVVFNDAFNTIRLCKRQLSSVFILAISFLLKMVKIIFGHLKFLNYLHYL